MIHMMIFPTGNVVDIPTMEDTDIYVKVDAGKVEVLDSIFELVNTAEENNQLAKKILHADFSKIESKE